MSDNEKNVDVFSQAPTENQDAELHENNDDLNQETETPKKEGFQPKFIHFLLVGILAGVIWIFWPKFFGNSKPVQQTAENSNTVLSPNQAMLDASQANQNGQQPAAQQTGSTNQLMEQAAVNVAPPVTTNNGIYTPEQIAAINANEATFNKALADAQATGDVAGQRDAYQAALNMSNQKQQILLNKISSLEQEVTALKTRDSQMKVAVKNETKPKEKTAKEILAREKIPPVKKYKGNTLSNYRINTIYTDNAWIEYEGETFSVKAGDRIGKGKGIQIQKIDANSHTILTSAGLIK